MVAVEVTNLFELNGDFIRKSGKFHHMVNPVLVQGPGEAQIRFYDRGAGKPSVVAVYDPANDDYRIKTWLEADPDTHSICMDVNDRTVTFYRRGGRLFEVETEKRTLHAILHDEDATSEDFLPAKKEAREEIQQDLANGDGAKAAPVQAAPVGYLDRCIETPFDTGDADRDGAWVGDPASAPDWMRMRSISIRPIANGGSWIHIDTELRTEVGKRLLGVMRINGVWCVGIPANGYSGEAWNGSFLYSATPEDVSAIAAYGDGLADIAMEDEPAPPRTVAMQREIALQARRNGKDSIGRDFRPWRDAIMVMNNNLGALCSVHRQARFHETLWRRDAERAEHYKGLVQSAYDRRPNAYRDYKLAEWLAEVGGKADRNWLAHVALLKEAEKNENRSAELEAIYVTKLDVYKKALAKCEEMEEKYAEEILETQPKAR